MDDNIVLFEKLLEVSKEITKFTDKSPTYSTQFKFSDLNKRCYERIYSKLDKVVPRKDLFPLVDGLEMECANCWKFYLSPRNKSIRILDIQLGKKFEEFLIAFLKQRGVDCKKGDVENKMFPDNVVVKGDKNVAYLEVKYQSAPWIFAYREEGTSRECFEGSPALDIKKLEQQKKLVDEGKIDVPVYYVYWLDFPCIKGIFYISLEDAYNFYKTQAKIFERKERAGDFTIKDGKKIRVSAITKIHISIFMMKDFVSLMSELSV